MTFAVGDRVRIVDRTHPWARHSGQILAPLDVPSEPDLKWEVELDGWLGHRTAVAEDEIRKAPCAPR